MTYRREFDKTYEPDESFVYAGDKERIMEILDRMQNDDRILLSGGFYEQETKPRRIVVKWESAFDPSNVPAISELEGILGKPKDGLEHRTVSARVIC